MCCDGTQLEAEAAGRQDAMRRAAAALQEVEEKARLAATLRHELDEAAEAAAHLEKELVAAQACSQARRSDAASHADGVSYWRHPR